MTSFDYDGAAGSWSFPLVAVIGFFRGLCRVGCWGSLCQTQPSLAVLGIGLRLP